MAESLKLRKTFKYVGTYQDIDDWDYIGTFKQIGREDMTTEEMQNDMCEPTLEKAYIRVKPDKGVTQAQIKQALHDSLTQAGCGHEYDCCGCRSYYASNARKIGGPVWQVMVSSSRNY